MSKYFSISGYWKDDKSEFEDLVVKESEEVLEDDEDIFFYGLSEKDIIHSIENPQEDNNLDFVITNYEL